jgi:hypothetical protein
MAEGFRPQTGEPPTFGLRDAAPCFWWEHDCRIDWSRSDSGRFDHLRDGSGDVTLYRAGPQRLPLNPEHGWHLTSADPLTITPSILCHGCGTHGFITNSAWVGV